MSTARQTSVVTRNVSDASNPDYTRRIAVVTSTAPGARSVDIQRVTNDLLFRQNLSALSAYSGQNALYSGMLVVALTGPFIGGQISAFTNVIFERIEHGF